MKKYTLYYCFLIYMLLFTSVSNGQDKQELTHYYADHLQTINDTTIQNNKLFLDTLFLSLDSVHTDLLVDYNKFYKDSVYAMVKDSINQTRKNKLSNLNSLLKNQFESFYKQKTDSIKNLLSEFVSTLNNNKQENSDCRNCRNKSDANNRLDEFADLLDSLSGQFQDRISITADTVQSVLEDSIEGCKDSLSNYGGDLIGEQLEEQEGVHDKPVNFKGKNSIYESEESDDDVSSFELDAIYSSHDSYRGRDNGYTLSSLSPTITYNNKHGFSLFTSLTWLDKPVQPLDEIDAGFSLNFDLSDVVSFTLGYEHSWYQDTVLAKSLLDNSIEAALGLDAEHFKSDLSIEFDFGGGNWEANLSLDAYFPIILSRHVLKGTLSFQPGGTLNYGSQNSELVARRKRGIFGLLGNSKKTNVFGIMDYELALPLVLELKAVSIKPQIGYIFPENVIDNSSKDPFLYFSLEVTVPFRFK